MKMTPFLCACAVVITLETLASMVLHSIWVTRNKTAHREGLCDREGTVAIRIQLYF